MKDIVVKKESTFFLWEEGCFGNNIGIVWDQEYAELINVALKFYKEHKEVTEKL